MSEPENRDDRKAKRIQGLYFVAGSLLGVVVALWLAQVPHVVASRF